MGIVAVEAKIRYRARLAQAVWTPLGDSRARVTFDAPPAFDTRGGGKVRMKVPVATSDPLMLMSMISVPGSSMIRCRYSTGTSMITSYTRAVTPATGDATLTVPVPAAAKGVVEGFKMLKSELSDQNLWLDGVFLKRVNDDLDELKALGEALAEISPDLYIVRTTRRILEGVCEPVTAEFRDVVTSAWAEFDFPVRFFLPEKDASSS